MLPQVNPAPNAANNKISPLHNLPEITDSFIAIGIVPAVVLPYSLIFITTLS